jgi:hypothetical protein
MALKPDRKITDGTDISFFMNATAEKGSVVILSAGGSGAAMDDGSALASLQTVAYGSANYPLGILMCDVVSGDLTKTHLNYAKDEVQVGGKVTICRRGTVLTNMIDAAAAPTAGQGAYVGAVGTDGKLCSMANSATTLATTFAIASGGQATFATGVHVAINNPNLTRIGTWLSAKDADGYAKLDINLI